MSALGNFVRTGRSATADCPYHQSKLQLQMHKIIIALFFIAFSAVKANMPYLGPAKGNVAGRDAFGNIRIKHELLTVDMRNLPHGKISVFANYNIFCNRNQGTIRFLFAASGEVPVAPEIIADGKVVIVKPTTSKIPDLYPFYNPKMHDSLTQIIGLELGMDTFHHQPIADNIFAFDVEFTEGVHILKIGYFVQATGYDEGLLRHYCFPYFLGNKYTRPLYDSIFVRVLFPEDVQHSSNIAFTDKGTFWESGNIAGFKASHMLITIFKDVSTEINQGLALLHTLQIISVVLLTFLVLLLMRWQKDKMGKIRSAHLFVAPITLIIVYSYYYSLWYFYSYFSDKYGDYLHGYFGHSYYFFVSPFLLLLVVVSWFLLTLVYTNIVYKTRMDPTNLVWKRKGSQPK